MAATAHMQRPISGRRFITLLNRIRQLLLLLLSLMIIAVLCTHNSSPQLTQPMYGYPQYQSLNQVHQPQYATHPSQSQHPHQNSPPADVVLSGNANRCNILRLRLILILLLAARE